MAGPSQHQTGSGDACGLACCLPLARRLVLAADMAPRTCGSSCDLFVFLDPVGQSPPRERPLSLLFAYEALAPLAVRCWASAAASNSLVPRRPPPPCGLSHPPQDLLMECRVALDQKTMLPAKPACKAEVGRVPKQAPVPRFPVIQGPRHLLAALQVPGDVRHWSAYPPEGCTCCSSPTRSCLVAMRDSPVPNLKVALRCSH
mmetsp:Transcript_11752/g.20031  ORF Transcript_11752/g.20031 Transcript_11752/m.20031 type:complete len:202 (+) Transcript_11752:414-1019(+)